MATAYHGTVQRPREWRRRVSIYARVRTGEDWGDCRILNISTRGMLLQYSRPLSIGGRIEIRQQGKMVPARVVWCQGMRAGLSAEQPIAIYDWLQESSEQAASLGLPGERRKHPRPSAKRTHDDWQQLGRKVQFVAVSGFAAALALSVAAMAASVVFAPLRTAAGVLTKSS